MTPKSSRWNTEDMDSAERNSIYIKELGVEMGVAWHILKCTWRELKYNLSIGDYEKVEELKAKIYRLRKYMGISNDELY
jgi:hypothetical protein